MKIAVIGAGLAGLSFAHQMHCHADIDIFEKARGPGGRMSCRYNDDFQFDHGAQFFTVKNNDFKAFLSPFENEGIVRRWSPRIAEFSRGDKTPVIARDKEFYLASPKMNALCKALAAEKTLYTGCRIISIDGKKGAWFLKPENNFKEGPFGPYDWIVTTAPPLQAIALLPEEFSERRAIANASLQGCFTLMLGLSKEPEMPSDMFWDMARFDDDILGMAFFEHVKPGRNAAPCLTVHADNDFSDRKLEHAPDDTKEILINALAKYIPGLKDMVIHSDCHRWRYAAVVNSAGQDFLADDKLQIAACGDWCIAGRVEAAFESALALSQFFIKKAG